MIRTGILLCLAVAMSIPAQAQSAREDSTRRRIIIERHEDFDGEGAEARSYRREIRLPEFLAEHMPPEDILIEIPSDADIRAALQDLPAGFPMADPEIREMEREARDLARQIQATEGAERSRLEADLDALLGKLFDRRTEARNERLEKLRDRLKEEEELLKLREKNRSRIIEERKRELLDRESELDW